MAKVDRLSQYSGSMMLVRKWTHTRCAAENPREYLPTWMGLYKKVITALRSKTELHAYGYVSTGQNLKLIDLVPSPHYLITQNAYPQ